MIFFFFASNIPHYPLGNVFIYPISFLLENNPYICPCIINLMTNDTYEDIEFYENAILIGSYSRPKLLW